MAIDVYAPCPCGSGKKFRWCCQPIQAQINKAFQQDEDGQHETAMRLMDELTREHATNPEAWGRKAQLLFENGRYDDAEKALDRALELNPNYPFGYYLRGSFRRAEGELPGALLLFRQAAERYDPEAREALGQLYALIGDTELKLNNPVAARMALQLAVRFEPRYQQSFEQVFGPDAPLPAPAKRAYAYREALAGAAAERKTAWEKAQRAASAGKLGEALRTFAELSAADEQDAAAWYNLGLSRAWAGENGPALDALDRHVGLEKDESKAIEAWELGEVLRTGHGMEERADYVEHAAAFPIRDPQRMVQVLEELSRAGVVLLSVLSEQEGVLSGMFLEQQPTLAVVPSGVRDARLQAHLLVSLSQGFLRVWSLSPEDMHAATAELRQRAGPALGEPHERRSPAPFAAVFDRGVVVPVGLTDAAEVQGRMARSQEQYLEDRWPHQPLRSLSGVPPIDAAGHASLRVKLLAIVQYLQDCAPLTDLKYDFDRLRRKLGLLETRTEAKAGPDLAVLGAAELAGLNPEALDDQQLEEAYHAALRLDARDLAGRFGRTLLARPASPQHADRYPIVNQLVQQTLAEGDFSVALDLLNTGEKNDCEQNEGRRRNDYELRRGQIQAKSGELEAAQGTFERLLERAPAELKYAGTAAETMLSARQGRRALRFAELGLTRARQQNNRDSEQYFLELVDAAKRQGS
jgi:tetratricopeptide (TPR) repeat protein